MSVRNVLARPEAILVLKRFHETKNQPSILTAEMNRGAPQALPTQVEEEFLQ